MKVKALLSLTRPANLVTAIADVLAGMAIAGYFRVYDPAPAPVGWLALATVGLYGGGVVFNDVFDAELDAVERPERPIGHGRRRTLGQPRRVDVDEQGFRYLRQE